jgi:methylthioribose-1-phosphate isomerase
MPPEIFSPIRWRDGALELLDQTRLPQAEEWLRCTRPEQVADAIRRLAVRGAPAIGVAAAYGLVLGLLSAPDGEPPAETLARTARLLGETRPTAVNLRWALDRGRDVLASQAESAALDREAAAAALLAWAERLQREDIASNLKIGEHGRSLFAPGDRVLTHCNTGALATAGYGTALGVLRAAHDAGRLELVWVDETRPLLQGSRLTAWELERLRIPYRLIPDAAAAALMARGDVQAVIVGADRIAANGDTANKIGTYGLAVLARHHGVPFYFAAPLSTIDPATPSGAEIPIEERSPDEVRSVFGAPIAPPDAPATNLAFDVTPAELIAAIVTDAGVLRPPYGEAIARALKKQAD